MLYIYIYIYCKLHELVVSFYLEHLVLRIYVIDFDLTQTPRSVYVYLFWNQLNCRPICYFQMVNPKVLFLVSQFLKG